MSLEQAMIDVAIGKKRHDWRGTCPDSVEGYDSRDPQCPACKVLIEFERKIKEG
jgi:hypothetical protein